MSIRFDVEDRQKQMAERKWYDAREIGWIVAFCALLPIIAIAAIANGIADGIAVRRWRKANGYCQRCGHKHAEPLVVGKGAHHWDKGEWLCGGSR